MEDFKKFVNIDFIRYSAVIVYSIYIYRREQKLDFILFYRYYDSYVKKIRRVKFFPIKITEKYNSLNK